jgi:phosphatidylglycerophosphate synthase
MVSLLLLNSGFLEHLDGRPLARLGWANLLTVARLFFLPFLPYLLWLREWRAGLFVYVVLGLTDVVDGMVARRRGEESKLGFVLDPFVDILFHLAVLISLAAVGILSWWTGSLVLARYLLLLLGCGLLYLTKGEIWIQPTPFGKGTGLAISVLTSGVLLLLGLGDPSASALHWGDRGLAFFFAAGLIHVVLIGWENFRRPSVGGTAVYRRGWGLLVGHRAEVGAPGREPRDKPSPK